MPPGQSKHDGSGVGCVPVVQMPSNHRSRRPQGLVMRLPRRRRDTQGGASPPRAR